jgi:hypothetical protein
MQSVRPRMFSVRVISQGYVSPPMEFEIEAGDDFFLNSETVINSATFVGLLTGGAPEAN